MKRYALHLVDTVQIVGSDKAICLTTGVKSIKDTMFFLNQDDEEDAKVSKSTKKPPVARAGANGNASPTKNKMAGGKVLRNKTRSAAQEVSQSTAAKIAEHQRELHDRLQTEGLTKYSEGGGGAGGKEGKGWKRFQSYKGEAALPREVENLRVGYLLPEAGIQRLTRCIHRSSLTEKHKRLFSLFTVMLYLSISTPSRTSVRMTKVNSHTFE